jgi:hypothetical protein
MHRAHLALAAVAALATTALGGSLRAAVYAPGPDAPWQYGFSATASLAPAEFRPDSVVDAGGPIRFWHPAATSDGYYPYVAWNSTARTLLDPTRSWAVRPGELAMEGSNGGLYSVVRFAVPEAGRYRVKARFTGIHLRASSTDVHVLVNATPVFDAVVQGYGGDPAFHAIEGPLPRASYAGAVRLVAGDVVSFAVGYGRNRTHFNDTTGLVVRIRRGTDRATGGRVP